VLIHVEVQGEPKARFAERMYVYHYRLFDHYQIDIVSLAVLADARPSFRPAAYQRSRWGCELSFRFPVQKLLDWHARWGELEASPNPFGLVVMAHLKQIELKFGPPSEAVREQINAADAAHTTCPANRGRAVYQSKRRTQDAREVHGSPVTSQRPLARAHPRGAHYGDREATARRWRRAE